MSRPKAERPDPRPCRAPGCRKRIPWRDGMKPSAYARLDTCSRACGGAFGHRRRLSYKTAQPHQCALPSCSSNVARVAGERESVYRRRRYCCDEHRLAGRRAATATWGCEVRVCGRDGCDETFTPSTKEQRYHDHPCSVLARGARVVARETKVCVCPCQEVFERPSGISAEAWARRRFVDAEHRARGSYVSTAKPKKATATGEPGSSRAGRRKAPRISHAKPARRPDPDRSVFGDAGPAAPWRPPAPVVVRIERSAPRPRFGLSRVS